MQKISLQKRSFFNSIGLDTKNLPNELQMKSVDMNKKIPIEEINFLNNDNLVKEETKAFRLKNVIGTDIVEYTNKNWIDIFIENEKTDDIIKQYFKNPNYYYKELRKIDQSNLNHNSEIKLYENNGKYFIKDGVARLSLMMIKYLLEMSRAQTKEERILINKQYTFVADVKSIPKDNDIIYFINMLSDIYGQKINVEKADDSEKYNYNIKYGERVIAINGKNEFEKFIKNSYLPRDCKSEEKLKNKLINLTKIGIEYRKNENYENQFLAIGKIFPNYEVFIKYYNKLQKYNIEDKLYENVDLENVTYESILKEIIKIVKQEENNMKVKSDKKVKKETIDKKDSNEKTKNKLNKKDVKKEIKNEEKKVKNNESTKEEKKVKINEIKNEGIDTEKKKELELKKKKEEELANNKQTANEQVANIIENIEMMYYKLKSEEAKIIESANGANITLNIDRINDENVNSNINSIKENSIKLKKKIEKSDSLLELKNINELLKDLKKLSNDRDITINYIDEMKVIFYRCFNKTIQKLITDSKLKKLEIQRIEIENEKCSFFSKLIGKAKLKQAKLDNINLKKQLILSESQFGDRLYYYLEDGLSDIYAYVKNEANEECIIDINAFLRNIESNIKFKQLINQEKLNSQIKEKLERQRNLPQLTLSKEKRKLFSKAQINLMQEKNNELKKVIQITRANSLKQQNTGMIPILGNIKATKSLNKFYNNLNEISLSFKYQCN